ncbi:hypothetical protein [Actinomadura harenae]|uniref:Uncharacterized protein n=1 Tax=Actinomadura harenae TaxID=2483351 RepID=A0A3M2LPB5_9ACTN|nr:hypothetical protein [Actinomadura harenae]RMI39172.1 hypothetical protein EBO15_30410 [Actinomadura harenae]
MTVMELESTKDTTNDLDRFDTSRFLARLARGTRGRAALEVYVQGGLYDVTVADGYTRSLLRGAVHGPGWVLAWGQLPPDGAPVEVSFTGRRLDLPVRVQVLGDRFWVATADVRARSVVVAAPPETVTSRLRAVRRRSPRR